MPAGLTLTLAGAAEAEAAWRAGTVVTITAVVFGDGGGKPLPSTPDEMSAMTALNGAFGREPFSYGEQAGGLISGSMVIDCKDYPGKTLREVGLVSESGTLFAYGVYPDTYLPAQTDSVIKEVILTLVLELTHAESVTLLLDPERMVLTQDAGDKRYLRISEDLAEIAAKGDDAQARGRAHLDVYSRGESDDRFQSKGAYYTKTESDNRFQPKGDYTPANTCYDKTASDARYVQNYHYTAEAAYRPAGNESSWTFRAPAGCTISGVIVQDTGSNSADNIAGVYYKAAQIYVNGAWRTVSG
ncbi:phage tail protein [Escherichia coli]